jgi:hypothetical protein
MDPFFMYVSIGALVLLILTLSAIGVAMTQLNSVVPFPSTQNTCPDNWDVSGSNPSYCGVPLIGNRNVGYILAKDTGGKTQIDTAQAQNIGMCNGNGFGCKSGTNGTHLLNSESTLTPKYHYVKLNDNPGGWGAMYPGVSERCAKKRWASTLNVTWDGVTNFNGC